MEFLSLRCCLSWQNVPNTKEKGETALAQAIWEATPTPVLMVAIFKERPYEKVWIV